jgi:O-antigen ligase
VLGIYKISLLRKISQTLWAVFLFTFPLSIRYIVYEEASYRFGNFNPWVTGFVYAPEILLFVIFILWLLDTYFRRKARISHLPAQNQSSDEAPLNAPDKPESTNRKYKNILIALFLLFIINACTVTFLKGDYALLAFFMARIVEIVIIYTLISEHLLPDSTVIRILLAGALFQFIWGWLQWKLNHSLGFSLLGESVIGPDILGVAKTDLVEGAKQIRPYGSFLHPNIFAAYLMAIILISIPYLKKFRLAFWLVLLTGAVYFTKSSAASIVILVCFVLIVLFSFVRSSHIQKYIAFFMLLLFFLVNAWVFVNSSSLSSSDPSLQERLDQNIVSHEIFIHNPFGVGVSNYTLEMEKYGTEKLQPWEFQPVHNTYFLILNETGPQGLVILLVFAILAIAVYWKGVSAIPVLSLLLLAPFDHFLWDSFAGLVVIALVAGFYTCNEMTIRRNDDMTA